MSLGGGAFLVQNKILPGAYINFVALNRANIVFSDRGVATIPLVLEWGDIDNVIEVTTRDFQRHSKRIFGYDFTHPNLRGLRDLFRNIRVGYFYRLGSGGARASNDYATARHVGERGNEIKIVVAPNVDEPDLFDVTTIFDSAIVEIQTVRTPAELADNDFVTWRRDVPAFSPTAGMPLTGGISPVITNADYQTYLEKIEGFSFNAIGCPSNEPAVKLLFSMFTRRMRDEQGVKFQCVTHDNAFDYEGVVNVMNTATDSDANPQDLVWWTTGIIAGTPVNRTATNNIYDGEFTVDCDYTQLDYERAIRAGKFSFYRSGSGEMRVLSDINSLVSLSVTQNADFQYNQTIRVLDQIGNDIAMLFNTLYLGEVPNDEDGRISLWSDIVKHHEMLQNIRAIQEFMPSDIVVEQGNTRRSVLVTDTVMPVNAMSFLYMTVQIA
ncbi:MAG: phage tail sheath family protein [Defluviitaleaceae bacterium]|nr:phage tail sheath family protein [Defluviitaleaceae bacterium]